MKEIMEVFRATELSEDVKIRVIKKLGIALNKEYGMNWTEEIVDELVGILRDYKAQRQEDLEQVGRF